MVKMVLACVTVPVSEHITDCQVHTRRRRGGSVHLALLTGLKLPREGLVQYRGAQRSCIVKAGGLKSTVVATKHTPILFFNHIHSNDNNKTFNLTPGECQNRSHHTFCCLISIEPRLDEKSGFRDRERQTSEAAEGACQLSICLAPSCPVSSYSSHHAVCVRVFLLIEQCLPLSIGLSPGMLLLLFRLQPQTSNAAVRVVLLLHLFSLLLLYAYSWTCGCPQLLLTHAETNNSDVGMTTGHKIAPIKHYTEPKLLKILADALMGPTPTMRMLCPLAALKFSIV